MEINPNNQPINPFLIPNSAQLPTSNIDYQNLDYNALASNIAQKLIRNTSGGAQILVNGKWTSLGGGGVQVSAGAGNGQASFPATQTFTCGFRPKLIRVKGYMSNAAASWSMGEKTDSVERDIFYNPNVGRIQNSNFILYMVNASGTTIGKASATITDTGFTLNFVDYDSSTCYFNWEAIG